MDSGMPSNNEDTPMQNEDSTVTSQTWTTTSSLVTNGPGLSLFRSPNLPPTHFILLKTPVSGGSITTENCFVVDISNLQSQNLTLVPAITQATVKPPTEEQDSKERVQNYIRTLSLPSSSQTGSLNVDDNQSILSANCAANGTLTQISNSVSSQPGVAGVAAGVNGALVRNGDIGDSVVAGGASSVQAQQSQQGQLLTASAAATVATDISSSSAIGIDAESLASAFIQQTGQTTSAVIATAGAVTQGAIITDNAQSMVNVLTNSAVVASGGILVTGSAELDYRSSHGGIIGCGGVASYSNVTSPSICTSPSDDDQMDGTNDFVSSDNEDISDINRSLIQSGNLEKGATGSGPNSGNVTPGGSIDFINYQQMNMANGMSGDLPTMVLKGNHEHNASGEITTISSDSYSDSGGAGGVGFVQTRSKRMYDSSSSCPISMYSRNTLISQFPSAQEEVALSVVNQPESRHRPRYLTEGSRGSVKDRSGNGYPSVKLTGFTQCPLTLQVFIGTDTGRPKPHGFFQACRVTGRNVISCLERNIDGTQIMEIDLDPKNDMKVDIDCIGILKLRNADVEAMESTTRSKKKSQRARMVFRVSVPRSDGSSFTLQTMSDTIQCSQPTGQPEIVRLTTDRSPACGGGITYVLGKHFTRPVVTFSRKGPLNGNAATTGITQPQTAIGAATTSLTANNVSMTPAIPKVAPLLGATGGGGSSSTTGVTAGGGATGGITLEETWSEVAELLNDCISQHYVGCKIPAYCNGALNQPVYCEVTVTNGDNKVSDPAVFVYTPNEEAPTLQAILSLPNSTWTACPIASVSSSSSAAANSVVSEMQAQVQHSVVSTSAAGGGIGSASITTASSTSTACYSSCNNAKRSRTCQPETEVMEQSPGSSSNGGPVASDSGSSLHSKMAPVSSISASVSQNVTPVQFNPGNLVAAVNQTSMNVSSSTYNSQSLMNLQPLVAKPVPGIIPALNNSQNNQDPSKAHFILPGGTSVLQIQQNGSIKTATINPSQPICSTVLQSTGHQQVTNVSYSGVEIVGSFIKPENETPTCSKSLLRGNAGPVQYPVVMPRGMMTNIAPSQSSLPHPPVMGNTMSALNFRLPPPTPLLTGSADQTMVPSVPTAVPNIGNPTPQTSTQFIQPNTANNLASQSQVPMEITKIPPPSQPQPSQQQPTQSIPQQPPSDSPMSGSTITNPASVGSDTPSSAATTFQTTSTATSSTTPDINSILKGLLLIGAQSANPSAYAEFALQIANQIQKDGAESGSCNSNSNPSASMEANSSGGFNSQSPVAACSTSVVNAVTETISSVNPINTTLTALPSSSMNAASITTAVQQLSNVPPVGNQQSVQQLSQPVSSNEINTNFQHQPTTAPPHAPMGVVASAGASAGSQVSQTAQLTAAAIAKNPELAPFAPHLISAVEAVQQQSLNAASRDPNQKEQLLQQLQLLLQQEAIKLASLAEAQHQQGQGSSSQQQQPPQQQLQAGGGNQSFNYIITPSQNSQTQIQTQSLTQTPSESMSQQPIIVSSTAQQYQIPLQQASQSLHRQVSISSSQQMQQAPLSIQQQSTNVATPQLQHIVSGAQPTMESLQQSQQTPQKAVIGTTVTPSTSLSSNNQLYFQVQSVVPQSMPPTQQQAMNHQNVGQASQPPQNVFQSSAQQQSQAHQASQQVQPTQQSSAPMINQTMLAAQQLQMQQTPSLQQQPPQPQQQQQYPQMFLLQQVEQQQNGTGTRKSSTEYAQSSCSGDQTPLSVQSGNNPPSVQSAPPSNLSSHSYELNSPFQSPGTGGALQQSQNQPLVTPQTSMSQCIPSSVSQVTPPQQKQQLPPPSAMPVHSIPSSSTATYVVYSQTPTCASVAATSISPSMFYSMSQTSGSELHCSNMDLSDPELYSTHNQNQHVLQQNTANTGQQEMADENMFKEPYPVNNSSSVDWQPQRNSTSQFSNSSLNDLSQVQHQVLQQQQQQQQHSSMNWETSVGPHSSMTWESTSGNSTSTASIHQPSSMKSSTTDPFLSSGQLENSSVQQASSLMDIHQASTFEHDQNSQSSSISSSELHELDLLSQIAQSPLCAILSNDSLFAPSPAPVVTPEEPPARGAAVLKYLIEKGFIDGEQRNIVTAEAIESAICELSKQKPITEITFEDVVSVLFGSKNG